ncbi:MAG: sigma 54-interacting transcriptional regulator [Deltaproteobacteria bacterium]|nr:sigma 54-interacting transcriptional regulator [Deltaproteobacteria bacterium]
MSLSLLVVAGPDLGRRIALREVPISIGRGQSEALRLADTAVSRHHLTVRLGPDGRAVVEEIGGVNPVWTLVEGQRVTLMRGHTLGAGATLTLGSTTLQVVDDAAAPAAPVRSTVELDASVVGQPTAPSRLAALAALGDRLARCSSLQAVLREATTWALHALPASRALLLSPDGSDILSSASDGVVPDLAMSRALLDRVRHERRAFLVRDVQEEPDLADRRSVLVRGIAGAMAAPASNLVFYVEWGAKEAATHSWDEEALLLLLCAAHLVSALGDSASERSQLKAAASVRRGAVKPVAQMIGKSAPMQKLQVFIERVASSPATVLIRGESGTGKELAAAIVHGLSSVADGPFIAINCAAIPEQLLESELFGHERGAFTGAVAQHDGVFSRADGGTLFLDEIGEMSLSTQARMLRVLETRSFTRVGGTREISVAVRLVAATHRDLRAMVADGRFREDLLYRLSVIQTELPPLRERPEDIEPLVRHFAAHFGDEIGRRFVGVAPEALTVLTNYRWPGNVRELRNVVERAMVLGDGTSIELDDLPPELLHSAPAKTIAPPTTPGTIRTLEQLERDAIAAALDATGGNKARAAALLGIDRTTLYRKLKDYDISR